VTAAEAAVTTKAAEEFQRVAKAEMMGAEAMETRAMKS
jgi:hypothetical protein